MKRSATALFLFAVAAFCQTPKDGGISGKITDAVTHEPISGAKVSCSAPCAGESAMSDANGYWSFPAGSTAPPPGSDPGVVVSVSKSGYATLGPIGLPMHAGVHATHDFELSPSASLTGRLLDRDSGKPIRAHLVTVTLRNPQPGQKTKFESKETAEDGSFAIGDLYAGEYTLEIDPSMTGRIHSGVAPDTEPGDARSAWGPSWYPDAPRADMAAPVVLSPGENRTVEVRLVKRHMRRIAGIVEVPDGIQAAPFPRNAISDRRKCAPEAGNLTWPVLHRRH